MCRLSWNLGASTSWNPQGLSRPVMGLLCVHIHVREHLHLNYVCDILQLWTWVVMWLQDSTTFKCKSQYLPNSFKSVRYLHTLIIDIQYTGCPRRNVPDFGRVFLMLKYTDITQNTYVQSWTVTEIMDREVWNFDSCYTLVDYQIHIKTGRNMWFL